MRRMISLGMILLTAGLLQGCVGPPKSTRTYTQSLDDHATLGAVSVVSRNGRVEVTTGWDAPSVTARLTCTGSTQEEADRRVEDSSLAVVHNASHVLMIEPVFAGGERSGDGASIVVRLAHADGVTIQTSNGSVKATGTAGSLDVHSSNGAISVERHAGPAVVRTSNGSVTMVDHRGTAHVDTSNGSIRVALTPDQTGPLDLRTSNGSITTTVGHAFAGNIEMRTSNANVRVDDPEGRATSQMHRRGQSEITVGHGGVVSRLSTSNGSVNLHIR